MKLRIKNTSLTLKFIAWLQIIGGIMGLLFIAYLLLKTETVSGTFLLIFIIGVALFIFSIYSGNELLFNPLAKRSIILVLINEIFQVVRCGLFGYSFCYSSGMGVLLGLKGLSIEFNFSMITSQFSMYIKSDNQFFIEINLVAIFLIVVLIDILNERKANSEENQNIEELTYLTTDQFISR